MDSHNFWYWMLQQAFEFIMSYLLPFIPRHVDWGLAQIITQNAAPMVGLVFVTVGEVVHLGTIYRVLQLLMTVQAVKLLLAARRIIAKLVKIALLFGLG